ncbi:MAG TPA: XRE family transcriptional regulator [Cyclobacteriaceae bacterium]|nr:XRE family transcriptional regulator [Cyclobacteriaceae bacterium]
MHVNKNIKFLRTRSGWTQKELAEKIGLKQPVIGAYEEERAMPPLNCLLDIADLFKVSIDALSRKDLSKLPEKEWKSFSGKKEVLAITVDKNDNENIELVSQKASAGYLNGYQDVEYIIDLPKIGLPVLPRNATYRAFEIKGDSMLPIPSGAIVFGEYVDNLADIKNGKLYIVVSQQEGIVFKRVFGFSDKKNSSLLLVSDNRLYEPYTIQAEDVLEVWAVKAYFSTQFPDVESGKVPADQLALTVLKLQEEVLKLKKKR